MYAPVLPFVWLVGFVIPIEGIRSGEWGGYVWAGLMLVTVCLALARRVWPPRWNRASVQATWVLPILSGLVPLAGLYLFAWYYWRMFGIWPQPMINDPKIIGAPASYERMFTACDYSFAFGVWAGLTWVVLMIRTWPQLNKYQVALRLCAFAAGWLLVACDPGRRLDWWLD